MKGLRRPMSVGSVPKLGIFNWPQELFVVHKAILILSGQALGPSPLLPGHPSPQSQRQALTQKRERKKKTWCHQASGSAKRSSSSTSCSLRGANPWADRNRRIGGPGVTAGMSQPPSSGWSATPPQECSRPAMCWRCHEGV